MNTLLFAVGIFIFMITVYGTVMAGGAGLKRKQKSELPPDQKLVINEDGYEVIVTTPQRTAERAGPTST